MRLVVFRKIFFESFLDLFREVWGLVGRRYCGVLVFGESFLDVFLVLKEELD